VVDAFAEDDGPPEIDPDSPISNPVNNNVIPPGGDGMRQSGSRDDASAVSDDLCAGKEEPIASVMHIPGSCYSQEA